MTNEFNSINIDSSKLTGMWKVWAEEADGHVGDKGKDGFINSAFEANTLKTLAQENGQSEDNINEIFGGNFTIKASDSDKAEESKVEQKEDAPASVSIATPTEAQKKAIDAVNFIIKALNKLKIDIPDWVPRIRWKKFWN